jgi:3-oxoacyl-[acyl-carrier-protein] synthase II
MGGAVNPSCSDQSGQDVVITGMGLVLPCGDGIGSARQSWISQSPCFDDLPPNLGVGRGAFCSAFNSAGIIPAMQLRRLDRPSRFAWAAVHQALADAGLDLKAAGLGDRMAMTVGTVTGGSEAGEVFMRPYFERGPEGASPMVFPNCVANAASGHVALAFGIKGPSSTQVARENATFMALEQAARWLRRGAAEAVLVIGTDGIFPLQMDLLRRSGRLTVRGNPVANAATGYLPGEGAQCFLLETRGHAESRGANIRAEVVSVSCVAPCEESAEARAGSLSTAVSEALGAVTPAVWIGGSNGSRRLDELEAALQKLHPDWPDPRFPKLIWGEFCGSGGQLLAAGMLEEQEGPVLITGPGTLGSQCAAVIRRVKL